MLSENTYEKYLGKSNQAGKYQPVIQKLHEWQSHETHVGTPVAITPSDPNGQIIYTPHDCPRPEVEDLPIGTIWECHGYRRHGNGPSRMCYDQWLSVVERGNVIWVLFNRNMAR